jgi:hypothetical protein
MEERGDQRVQVYRGLADYLSTINLGSGAPWNYQLKTLPRPTGRDTRVIITEYDLPREVIEPHDVIVDEEGIAWYSSFGEQNLGRLDPKTGEVSEFPVPLHKADLPTGLLGLRSDRDGNLWLGPAAALDQCAPRVCRQFNQSGHLLGGQQSRRFHHQAGTHGLISRSPRRQGQALWWGSLARARERW